MSDGSHIRLRLIEGDAISQSCDDSKMTETPGFGLCICSQGHPQFACIRKSETSRHNSYNCSRTIIDDDLLSDYFLIAAKSTLPQTVTKNDNIIVTRLVFFRGKGLTQCWRDSQDFEESVGDLH